MRKKDIVIMTTLGYFAIMIIGIIISNIVKDNTLFYINNDIMGIIIKLIIQVLCTIYLIYMIQIYFRSEDIGIKKLNIRKLIWFTPYLIILTFMTYRFIINIYKNINLINRDVIEILFFSSIGIAMCGFSEEVIFRGVILNYFEKEKSLILGMLISTVGFSIFHISTIITGLSVEEVIFKIINSSFIGFSFAALAIKMDNIKPLIVFHILWNFIITASNIIGIKLSIAVGVCNILNIFISIILWTIIIIENKKKKRFIFARK